MSMQLTTPGTDTNRVWSKRERRRRARLLHLWRAARHPVRTAEGQVLRVRAHGRAHELRRLRGVRRHRLLRRPSDVLQRQLRGGLLERMTTSRLPPF